MINNDINRWQEAISSLPDKQFFNTMRLYLGEIKTPYNKQRLTEQLAMRQSEVTGIFVEIDIEHEVITRMDVFRTDT